MFCFNVRTSRNDARNVRGIRFRPQQSSLNIVVVHIAKGILRSSEYECECLSVFSVVDSFEYSS